MITDSHVEPEVVDEEGASLIVGLAPTTLRSMRSRGGGPPYIKYGARKKARVVYRIADLRAWRDAQVVEPSRRCLAVVREEEAPGDVLARRVVDALDLSVRAMNCLDAHRPGTSWYLPAIETVEDLISQSEAELRRRLGRVTLSEIKQALAARGLALRYTVRPGDL